MEAIKSTRTAHSGNSPNTLGEYLNDIATAPVKSLLANPPNHSNEMLHEKRNVSDNRALQAKKKLPQKQEQQLPKQQQSQLHSTVHVPVQPELPARHDGARACDLKKQQELSTSPLELCYLSKNDVPERKHSKKPVNHHQLPSKANHRVPGMGSPATTSLPQSPSIAHSPAKPVSLGMLACCRVSSSFSPISLLVEIQALQETSSVSTPIWINRPKNNTIFKAYNNHKPSSPLSPGKHDEKSLLDIMSEQYIQQLLKEEELGRGT
jgi:hypothetical protein